MKIKQEILDRIDNPGTRSKIAASLNQGEQSIALACKANVKNGPLTKYAVLRTISEETGVPIEDIVEASEAVRDKVGVQS